MTREDRRPLRPKLLWRIGEMLAAALALLLASMIIALVLASFLWAAAA